MYKAQSALASDQNKHIVYLNVFLTHDLAIIF